MASSVAIAPRACVGDPAFDLIDWAFFGGGDAAALARRAERLAAEAGLDPGSLRRWCACTGVLVATGRIVRGNRPTEHVPGLLELAEADL
jgi:streptomycin 6-kinase